MHVISKPPGLTVDDHVTAHPLPRTPPDRLFTTPSTSFLSLSCKPRPLLFCTIQEEGLAPEISGVARETRREWDCRSEENVCERGECLGGGKWWELGGE